MRSIPIAARGAPAMTSGGFTLIEVMIVVALIGILAAIAMPSYQESIRKTRRTEARTALQQAMQQQERYYSVKNSYLKFNKANISAAAAGTDLSRFKWFSGASAPDSYYEIAATVCSPTLDLQECILVSATPNTGNVHAFDDAYCGAYTLRSDGVRANTGSVTPAAAPAGCW